MSDEQQPITVAKGDQDIQEAIRAGQIDEEREEFDDEALGDAEETPEVDVLDVDTAFVVFVQNGEAFGVANIGDTTVKFEDKEVHLNPSRKCSASDMWRASTEVAKDIEVQEIASTTIQMQMQQAMGMQRALQEQQIREQIAKGGGAPGPGGLHIPR